MAPVILSIGHSRHSLAKFLSLLDLAKVELIADVRSAPASRFSPHFNRNALEKALSEHGCGYRFLGKELGGRPQVPGLFTDGIADYEKMAKAEHFRAGLDRLLGLVAERRVAIMCAEADPLHCHRCLLIGRALSAQGANVGHILASGEIETQQGSETRLLQLVGVPEADLFGSRQEQIDMAYRAWAKKTAYSTQSK
jgi:uncharacterized protein (DUF488 family)